MSTLAFSDNAYLTVAHTALVKARRPLTPHEILDIARTDGFLPSHLYGATMHRTLGARLSENIRGEGDRSPFYRTAPSTFFLRSFASDPDISAEYKDVYVGHLRSKSIRKENVLVAPRDVLQNTIYGEYVRFSETTFEKLYRDSCRFVDRRQAEQDSSIKQFVTFTLVFHQRKILIYRRGKFTTTSDQLKGQLSVGFGGHVNDSDFSLFHRGGEAFKYNASRELREELFLDEYYRETSDTISRSNVLGYVNVDDSPDAEHHIAVLVAFNHKSGDLPKKGELSINQLSWIDMDRPINDLSDFDLWSGMILRNIFQGHIKMDANYA